MNVLVIDNYDSFTYNLVHILQELDVKFEVFRNDKIDVDEVERFDRIILSPGPGIPSEAGYMPQIIASHAERKPILGICLGHQALAEYMGARLKNMDEVFHGVKTSVSVSSSSLIFHGVPDVFQAGRYHSWVVDQTYLPDIVNITARDTQGEIMALEHMALPIYGLQFHPESVMTQSGKKMVANFLNIKCPLK